jgi:hypothetical protein
MTDPTPLSDAELDLAASLAIDGQEMSDQPMSVDDRRRVEARIAELRPAVAAVAEPVTPPTTEARARQIASALAVVSDGDPGGAPAPAARRPGRQRVRTFAPWAAAAAVVVLVVVALASLTSHGNSHSSSTSAAFEPVAGTVAGLATTTAPVSPQLREYGAAAPGLDTLADLGSVATIDQLDALARGALSATTTTTGSDRNLSTGVAGPGQASSLTTTLALSSAKNSAVERCLGAAGSLRPTLGPVVLQARATVGTHQVVVVVYEPTGAGHGQRYLVAFEMPSCKILVDHAL